MEAKQAYIPRENRLDQEKCRKSTYSIEKIE